MAVVPFLADLCLARNGRRPATLSSERSSGWRTGVKEDTMKSTKGIATIIAALAGIAMLVAGPIMIMKGFDGQTQVRHQLSAQKIVFPPKGSEGLPAAQAKFDGEKVVTGPEAKASADMVETHVQAATGGQTYSQVSAKFLATDGKDEALG